MTYGNRIAHGVVARFNPRTWWGAIKLDDRTIEFHATCYVGCTSRNLPGVGTAVEVCFSDSTHTRILSVTHRKTGGAILCE